MMELSLAGLVGPHMRLAAIGLVVVFCALAEKVAPGRAGPIGPAWTRRRVNLGIGAFSLLVSAVFAASIGALVTLSVNAAGGGWIALPSSGWGLVVGCTVYLLAMDLGEYLFHRAQHAVPALWTMHSLHHSDPALGVTTTVRHFWLEPALKTMTIWFAVGLLFKVSPTIAGVYAVAASYNFWVHSNVRVGFGRAAWLLNSPQYHRRHHSALTEHFSGNYAALLPIFDVICGSYHAPGKGEFPATGLEGGEQPKSVTQALIWPLRGQLLFRENVGASDVTVTGSSSRALGGEGSR